MKLTRNMKMGSNKIAKGSNFIEIQEKNLWWMQATATQRWQLSIENWNIKRKRFISENF